MKKGPISFGSSLQIHMTLDLVFISSGPMSRQIRYFKSSALGSKTINCCRKLSIKLLGFGGCK